MWHDELHSRYEVALGQYCKVVLRMSANTHTADMMSEVFRVRVVDFSLVTVKLEPCNIEIFYEVIENHTILYHSRSMYQNGFHPGIAHLHWYPSTLRIISPQTALGSIGCRCPPHMTHKVHPILKRHYADLKALVNTYIQSLAQTKWDVSVHGRNFYLWKPNVGTPKKYGYLQEETRL